MAKAIKATATKSDLELNRWCIEQAMRWPVVSMGGYAGVAQGYAQMPKQDSDADIIGRANKIMAWIKSPH